MRKCNTRALSFVTASIVVLATVVLGTVALAANPAGTIPGRSRTGLSPNIKADSAMVAIPVTVTDSSDYPVTGLSGTSVRVFEDKVERTVLSFSRQDGPVSVGFIVDASRRMQGRFDGAFAAIEQLLKTRTAGDEWFLIGFGDNPTILTHFTEDPNEILGALSSIQCKGRSALNDAVYLGVNEIQRARNTRKALIVLTDGGDNHSVYTESEVANFVRESDVRIYSIGLSGQVSLLNKLGKQSGGRALWAHKPAGLPEAIGKLSRMFRNEYLLGYVPNDCSSDEKYRQVLVKSPETTGRAGTKVSWRRGYYSCR